MSMAEYDPFARRPDLAPIFSGEPTDRLPFRNVKFLGGVFELLRPKDCELTSREFNYMTHASFGYSNPMIANSLGLATQTVHNQMSRLLKKVEVDGRSELLTAAFNLGYIAIEFIGEPPNLREAFGPRDNFPVTRYNLEIIRRIGSGIAMAAIAKEFGRSERTIGSVLDKMKENVGVSGSDTFFAAAVATGQVDPYTCELVADRELLARAA